MENQVFAGKIRSSDEIRKPGLYVQRHQFLMNLPVRTTEPLFTLTK